jgi:hypothetical protein
MTINHQGGAGANNPGVHTEATLEEGRAFLAAVPIALAERGDYLP